MHSPRRAADVAHGLVADVAAFACGRRVRVFPSSGWKPIADVSAAGDHTRCPEAKMRNWIVAGVARAIAVLVLLVGHAGVLRADPILVSDDRYVLAYVTTESPGTPIMNTRAPEGPFGPFDVSLS